MGDFETILTSVDDVGVATITLHRPGHRNAWNNRMGVELSAAMRQYDGDDGVRVVVVTGSDGVFCAGADLEGGGDTFARGGAQEPNPDRPTLPHQIRKPVVAAINGHAVGVGITYPLLADVRFVAADAKVAFAFVRRGIMPELASHLVLARVVGFSNAADLLLSGRTISGAQAAELGLASRALPADEVLPAALAWARDVAVNAAPVSVAIAKRLLWQGIDSTVADMLATEEPVFAWMGNQADVKEGVSAFLERRTPQWQMSVTRDVPPWPERPNERGT